MFSPFYWLSCMPVFGYHRLCADDCFYPLHRPRIAKKYSSTLVKRQRLPYVRRDTAVRLTSRNIEATLSACYESNSIRRLAEEYLLRVFSPLPYSLASGIALANERRFFETYRIGGADASYSRMLPSGSIGTNITKNLHDDKNGVVCPAIWQCVQADPANPVKISFFTCQLSWFLESSTDRFIWFNGLVPHKTELLRTPLVPSNTTRVHHSSYMKMEHEQLALITMSETSVETLNVTDTETTDNNSNNKQT